MIVKSSNVGHVNTSPKTVHFVEMSRRVVIGVKKGILTGLGHVRRNGLHERIRFENDLIELGKL